MYLNNATISKWELNGKSYVNSKKRFLKDLLETHRFSVQTVLGTKLATGGNVTFMENNGWVIAHVDIRFALLSDTLFSGLTVSILNNNQEIMSSYTDANISICGNHDIDADLYFVVGSFYPYNSNKDNLPESFFRSSLSQMLPRLDYSKLPDAVGGGDGDEEGGDDSGEIDDNAVLVSLPFAVSNGFDEQDGFVVYKTNEKATLRVYMDKADWDSIKSKTDADFYYGNIMAHGDGDTFDITINIVNSEGGDPVAAIKMPGSQSDDDYGKNDLCSKSATLGIYESGSWSYSEEYQVTVKFFVGNTEIKSKSYVPIRSSGDSGVFCVYDPDDREETGLNYQSSNVALSDGSSIYYKLSVFTLSGLIKDRFDEIQTWKAGVSVDDGQFNIVISDTYDDFTINGSSIRSDNLTLNDTYYVNDTRFQPGAFVKLQTFNEDGSIRNEESLISESTEFSFTKIV